MYVKIKVLPEDVAKKIAAGEVVERPASVVKELVENSIDAGSTRISVEVKGGGVRLIRVSDNGQGISEEDLPLAFERFATSKLTSIDDLLSLNTLGFRGEALPSIAAVSRVKLSTKREEELMGSSIRLEGGRVLEVSKVGRPKGTTVEVFDLFFNVPARRKFLKSTSTELRRIVEEITGFALAYPSISFRLVHNGEEILNLPRAEEGEARISLLFGPDFLSQMIYFNLE